MDSFGQLTLAVHRGFEYPGAQCPAWTQRIGFRVGVVSAKRLPMLDACVGSVAFAFVQPSTNTKATDPDSPAAAY